MKKDAVPKSAIPSADSENPERIKVFSFRSEEKMFDFFAENLKRKQPKKIKADKFIALAREKGYAKDAIEIMLMLSCCDAMEDNFGDAEKALTKMIELCKQCKTDDECVAEVCELAKV